MNNKTLCKLLDVTNTTIETYIKKDTRIIRFFNKYFTDDELEQFIRDGKIDKLDLLISYKKDELDISKKYDLNKLDLVESLDDYQLKEIVDNYKYDYNCFIDKVIKPLSRLNKKILYLFLNYKYIDIDKSFKTNFLLFKDNCSKELIFILDNGLDVFINTIGFTNIQFVSLYRNRIELSKMLKSAIDVDTNQIPF